MTREEEFICIRGYVNIEENHGHHFNGFLLLYINDPYGPSVQDEKGIFLFDKEEDRLRYYLKHVTVDEIMMVRDELWNSLKPDKLNQLPK